MSRNPLVVLLLCLGVAYARRASGASADRTTLGNAESTVAASTKAAVPFPSEEANQRFVAAYDAEREAERLLMVRAPDRGFAPKAHGYRLEVHVTPDGLRHKAGTPLRLKLEVKNIGDRPFVISQRDSMMKSRVDKDFYWAFTLTDSSGRTNAIHQPMGFDSGGGRFVAESEVPDIMRRAERAEVFRGLYVELRPGETLVSFPHDMDYPKDRPPSEADRFVEVSSPWDFRNPGVYTVEAKFRVARWNPVASTRELAVSFKSNRIRVEVVP